MNVAQQGKRDTAEARAAAVTLTAHRRELERDPVPIQNYIAVLELFLENQG